ncbi:MAG: hypothetical protein ACLPZM_04055 [Thermoplasmata archaeon]
MSELEWELRRIPTPSALRAPGISPPRRGAVAEFAALEFPRESVAWVVGTHRRKKAKVAAKPEPKAPKTKQQKLDRFWGV